MAGERILVAKVGLDGHDRGVKVVARILRDAGFEVIYTGLHQMPEQIAETVLQEDADAVGLSLLSGAHLTLFPRVMDELRQRALGDVLIFGGGAIPDADARALREQGVAVSVLGARTARLVTHMDVDDDGIDHAIDVLRRLLST